MTTTTIDLETRRKGVGGSDVAPILGLSSFATPLDIYLDNHLSGWDVLAELKAEPRTQYIPVIIVSVASERRHGLAMGAVDYLVKPVSREQLQQAIRQRVQVSAENNHSKVLVINPDKIGAESRPLILLAEDNGANRAA